MILHYLFISSYRTIFENLGFNFGGRFHFRYDLSNKELFVSLNPFFLPNFFNYKSSRTLAKIENISAIIGENGVGKTTLFDFIKENFIPGVGISTPVIVALTNDEGQLKIYHDIDIEVKNFENPFGFTLSPLRSKSNRIGKVEVIDKPTIKEFENCDFIYFSNIYDGSVESSSPGFTNISTNHLIREDYKSIIENDTVSTAQSELETHRTEDIGRQLDFINSSPYIKNIDFNLPDRLVVTLGKNYLANNAQTDSLSKDMLYSYEYSGFVKSLIEASTKAITQATSGKEKVHIAFISNAVINLFYESGVLGSYYRVGFLSNYIFENSPSFQEAMVNLLSKLIEDVTKFRQTPIGKPPHYNGYQSDLNRFSNLQLLNSFLIKNLSDTNSSENGEYFVIQNEKRENVIKMLFNIYKGCFIREPFMNFEWGEISTGEKALLNIYSRFYALSETSIANRIKAVNPIHNKDLVILIDEGEIYLHPNWQKRFVNYLLEFLPANFESTDQKCLQIILTSNSPIIASDLPNTNISFLKRSQNRKTIIQDSLDEKKQTFAGNIHSLLADGFFMRNGTVGDFAIKKIDRIIELLNLNSVEIEKHQTEIETVINLIGEPVVKSRLLQILEDKLKTSLIDSKRRISALESEIKRIKITNNLK